MNNLLTIITITKDNFNGLIATINSTREIRKIIGVSQIVVDSSIKSTNAKVKNICRDEHINLIRQSPSGISKAFNYGAQKSRSEWIWFLNSDDTLISKFDLSLLNSLLKNSQADIIIFEIITTNGISRKPPIWALWPPCRNWIPHPGVIMRRKIFLESGGFDQTLHVAMDGDMWFKTIGKNISVDLISVPIASFAIGGASSDSKKVANEMSTILRRYFWVTLKHLLGSIYRLFKEYFAYILEKKWR